MTYGRLVVLYLVAVLWQQPVSVHGHQRALETYEVSIGHIFVLKCVPSRTNVTWKRGGDGNSTLPAGVEVKNEHLWFFPVAEAHGGTYVCHNSREQDAPWERVYELRVSHKLCPPALESRQMTNMIPCKLEPPQGTNAFAPVEWLKECVPVNLADGHLEVTSRGSLKILRASESDAGLYTCLLHLSLGGNNYTASRSLKLNPSATALLKKPTLMYPKEEKVVVELGSRVELPCEAFLGVKDDETHMYWTISRSHFYTSPHLSYSWNYVEVDGVFYGMSSLNISSVSSELLDVPISCHLMNPAGQRNGTFWLRRANHSGLYVCVLLPLTLCLVALALVLGRLFRMELVLAYRRLRQLLFPQQVSDGMLYDAYVSYLYSNKGGSSEVVTFALKVLPKVLEKRHGFRLFIRGRDDCPGEAMHDVIAGALSKSRRLVLILSGQSNRADASPLHHGQSQLAYEHSAGLYDALTQRGLRVILVEIDGPVDYGALPESLRYIQRTQGALRWPGASPRNHTCTKLSANRTFWKSLRYHMPAAPQARPPSCSDTGSAKTKDTDMGHRKRSPIPVLISVEDVDIELVDSYK